MYSEIGGISRFQDACHLPSYTGPIPRVDQSGSVEIYGHLTKAGLSVLRFFIVNSVHTLIKLSPTFGKLYRKMKKRIGRNKGTHSNSKETCSHNIQHVGKETRICGESHVRDTEGEEVKGNGIKIREVWGIHQGGSEKIIVEITIPSQSNKLLS
ncbi:MAG: transposase [Thermoplasmatales archaeon]